MLGKQSEMIDSLKQATNAKNVENDNLIKENKELSCKILCVQQENLELNKKLYELTKKMAKGSSAQKTLL